MMDLKMDVHEDLKHLTEQMELRVKEMITEMTQFFFDGLLISILKCESPIEKMLALALENRNLRNVSLADDGKYIVDTQVEIETEKKIYRVDFLICAIFKGKERKVVVECDGHDFHEKTKEQARKDKSRDRALIKSGYEVIHFTGSEIYENPFVCARQVSQIVFKE